MTIPYTITPSAITLVIGGKHHQIDKSHLNFAKVRNILLDGDTKSAELVEEELSDLVDIRAFIAKISTGRVQVSGDVVMFDNTPVHGHIAERLLIMVRAGKNPRPLMRFLERLSTAPIKNVGDQFLHWLEKSNMPLTADGCFIAYKYVHKGNGGPNGAYGDGAVDGLWDSHSKKIDNSPGAVVPRFEPNNINTNRNVTCAESGYHFCSYNYLGSQRNVLLVKIAPEDVCSFPPTEEAKGRCLYYEIINLIPSGALEARAVEGGDLLYTGLYASNPSAYVEQDRGDRTVVVTDDERHEDEANDESDDDPDYGNVDDGQTHSADEDTPADVGPPERQPAGEKSETARQKWLRRLKDTIYEGKPLTQKRIMKLIGKHGQRKVAHLTGIPRTTLQEWLD